MKLSSHKAIIKIDLVTVDQSCKKLQLRFSFFHGFPVSVVSAKRVKFLQRPLGPHQVLSQQASSRYYKIK